MARALGRAADHFVDRARQTDAGFGALDARTARVLLQGSLAHSAVRHPRTRAAESAAFLSLWTSPS